MCVREGGSDDIQTLYMGWESTIPFDGQSLGWRHAHSLHMWAEDVSSSFSQGYWNHSLPLLYSCEKVSFSP